MADGLGLDGELILREILTARSWNRSGGSSWGIPWREIMEPHPNIMLGTAKADQDT